MLGASGVKIKSKSEVSKYLRMPTVQHGLRASVWNPVCSTRGLGFACSRNLS